MTCPHALRMFHARTLIAPLALAVGFTASTVSADIVIDDFSDVDDPNPWPVVVDTVGSTDVDETGLTGVIGGSRFSTITADSLDDPDIDDIQVTVATNNGRLDFASSAGAEGSLSILYDNNGSGLSTDFSGEQHIVLPFLLFDSANNTPLDVTITMVDDEANSINLTRSLNSPGSQLLVFEFDQFTRGSTFIFEEVDSIRIDFDGAIATDFRLGAIDTVIPAPGALAVIGLGLFIGRRRRRV